MIITCPYRQGNRHDPARGNAGRALRLRDYLVTMSPELPADVWHQTSLG
jgi:hypothetical protein